MRQKKSPESNPGVSPTPAVQLSLTGLILFSMSLVATSGAVVWLLVRPPSTTVSDSAVTTVGSIDAGSANQPNQDGPWGELIKENTHIECPEEYAAFELERSRKTEWVFGGMTTAQVRQAMLACGMTTELIDY